MPNLSSQTLAHMREAVFFEGPDVRQRLSRFWILLVLASIIASAGVVSDSTATVIGAMIVAPLMLPIQGWMLSVVLGDRANLVRSVALVASGALAAIAIGWLVGLVTIFDVIAESNSQVAGRVNPRLIDLLAALATGAVGSVALARRDISDTLPGVAIAISLVPPLVVVGLTLEAGELGQAGGALLLFLTNVAAILASGTVVMALYRVHRTAPQPDTAERRAINRRSAVLVIVAMLLIVGIPLSASTVKIARETVREAKVNDVSTTWADEVGWELVNVVTGDDGLILRFVGPLPVPDTDALRDALANEGIDPDDVEVELVPSVTVELEPAP